MSEHSCTARETCKSPGTQVVSYYIVGHGRRVRQWMCEWHAIIHGKNGVLPTQIEPPAHIQAAEQAEREFHEEFARRDKYREVNEDARSVKTLAPSGHGEPIMNDRALAFRWGGF